MLLKNQKLKLIENMPQLDKLSFSTQYIWLTLFFFVLYFISTNFFVILVFKNLKIRRIIYKVWYFFVYKFDYSQYEDKNKQINMSSFNFFYSNLYINMLVYLQQLSIINKFGKLNINNSTNISNELKNINNIDIDEI
jgi:hypothetical protein